MDDRETCPASDGSLLQQYRRGADDAATLLYFRYAEQLRSLASTRLGGDLACRVEADDIVQSVFRTFFRRAARGEFEVPEGEDLWRLFLVIALNKVRNAAARHRAARRDVRRTATEATEVEVPADALSHLRMSIDEVLSQLPESSRAIVERRVEGHEVAEIANLVGRSKRSVERVLREFRERLRAEISSGEP